MTRSTIHCAYFCCIVLAGASASLGDSLQLMRFGANTSRILIAQGKSIQITELNSNGTVIDRTIDGHEAMVHCLAASANGKLLVTGSGRPRSLPLPSADHSVRIWVTDTGKEVWSKKELPAEVVSVDISEDARSVLGVLASDTAYVWEQESRKKINFILKDYSVERLRLRFHQDLRVIPKASGDCSNVVSWLSGA